MDPRPPLGVELLWSGDLAFGARVGDSALVTDGKGTAGPSPMQLLVVALAGCMAADVVAILLKGRHPLEGLRASLDGVRADEPPRRLTSAVLQFHVTGDVPPAAVERAVQLSRDKYCSVFHSLRPEVEFSVAFEIHPNG
ncbi:MAG: OsmC family protein [Acidobacteria bacterium]|nr:OsmC family protein [Acidobacteriota bacterium]